VDRLVTRISTVPKRGGDLMAVVGVTPFERFFRDAADLDVDKSDVKRYEDFVREQIADLLTIAEARAKADDRDIIESRDLPITKGLQESIHRFKRLEVGGEVRPMLEQVVTRPQLDLGVADEIDEMLPDVAGGVSLALGETFRQIDTTVQNPATEHWERAFRIFDLLL
jgi:histone H3/H4